MVHPLQIQHRELTEQLDELDEAIAELTAALATPATAEPEEPVAQQEPLRHLVRDAPFDGTGAAGAERPG